MKRAWIALGVLLAVLGCSLWAVGAVRSQAAVEARNAAHARRAKKVLQGQSSWRIDAPQLAWANRHLWAGDEGRLRLVAAEVPYEEGSYDDGYYAESYESSGDYPPSESPAERDAIDGPRPWWGSEAEFGGGEYSPYDDRYYGDAQSELPNAEAREFGGETLPDVPAEPSAPAIDEYSDEAPIEEAPIEEAPLEEAPIEEAPLEVAPVEVEPESAPSDEAPATESAPVQEAPPVELPTDEAAEEADESAIPPATTPAEEAALDESADSSYEWFDESAYFLTQGEAARLEAVQSHRDDLAGWRAPQHAEEPTYLIPNSPYSYEYYILPEDASLATPAEELPRIGLSLEIDYELILAREYATEALKNTDAIETEIEALRSDTVDADRAEAEGDWEEDAELPPSIDLEGDELDGDENIDAAVEDEACELGSTLEPGHTTEHCPRICDGPICPLYDDYPAYEPAEAETDLPAGEGVEAYETYETPDYYGSDDETPPADLPPEAPTEEPAEVELPPVIPQAEATELNYDAAALGDMAGGYLPLHGPTADLVYPPAPRVEVEALEPATTNPLEGGFPGLTDEIKYGLRGELPLVALSPCEEEWYKLQIAEAVEGLRDDSGLWTLVEVLDSGSEGLADLDWMAALQIARHAGEEPFSAEAMPAELWDGLAAAPAAASKVLAPTAQELSDFQAWLTANVERRVQRIEALVQHITGQLLDGHSPMADGDLWSAGREAANQR